MVNCYEITTSSTLFAQQPIFKNLSAILSPVVVLNT